MSQRLYNCSTLFKALFLCSFFIPSIGLTQTADNTIQQPLGTPHQAPSAQRNSPPVAQAPGVTNPGQATPVAPTQIALPEAQMGNAPFPALDPALQKFLDEALTYWQQSTAQIQRFECKFNRWQFDPTKTNNPNDFYTASSGVIRYLKPDKGMFQVEDLRYRREKDGGKVDYEALPGHFGEWWICDGASVHEYDRTEKKVTKYPLPANMRGAEVFNSPLPFVFGVNAQKIKERYWVRPLPHPVGQDGKPNDKIIVIEAFPKFQADAINYHHVTIYLDRDKFLPQALEIALTQWTPQAPHREVFEFKDRETNAGLLAKINEALFQKAFIPEQPPKDWTVQEQPFAPEEPADGLRAANPNQTPPGGLQR